MRHKALAYRLLIVTLILACLGALYGWMHRTGPGLGFLNALFPQLISRSLLMQNLKSGDNRRAAETIAVLMMRSDFTLANEVAPYLTSDEILLGRLAAFYIGYAGDTNAVYYLIRVIPFSSERDGMKGYKLLRELTGVNLGDDHKEWVAWWRSDYLNGGELLENEQRTIRQE
jgi:hypothetical protein